jgi:hypothetical protein
MRGDAHVRFGGRAEETDRGKPRHRASVRPYTYLPMARGFCCLVAIMDWASRRVLSFRSNTLNASFCIEALEEALARYEAPEIMNTDQGSQVHLAGLHECASGTWHSDQTGSAVKLDSRGPATPGALLGRGIRRREGR